MVCSVCGRVLPTKHAVAGHCETEGCGRYFCALHWHNGNRKCPEHGWKPGGILAPSEQSVRRVEIVQAENGGGACGGEFGSTEVSKSSKLEEKEMEPENGKELCERAGRELPAARKESIVKSIVEFAAKLGQSTGQLAKKISGYKSPAEAMDEIDSQIESIRARREPLAKRYEELYRQIVQGKKAYQSAPAARKKILELELKGKIAEYQSLERQMTACLNNETVMIKVRGRMCELVAMNLRSVSEADIDKLTDRVDAAAEASEDIDGAIGDLDKAGARRERDDGSAFEEALAGFGDDLPKEPTPGDQIVDGSATSNLEDPLEV